MASSSTAPQLEYQHFVPQFLLRNFAHPYRPAKNGTERRKQPKKKGSRIYPGEPVLNNVNLLADPFVLQETPVKRVLGINNMYQDTSQPTAKQQRHIETLFGKMENDASPIFRKIVKAFDGGDSGIWLTRDERNRVRKFLFLLKYRGSTFHKRFYHVDARDYNCNDQVKLVEFMRERGFERPVDVWFSNITIMAELEMDLEDKWMKHLYEKVYPDDATWFIMHVQQMYMALCTPSHPGDEFIIADNSYNIFEGPNTFKLNPATGKPDVSSAWASFHEFAPVSPKLLIVLRHFVLPVPEEDGHKGIKKERDFWRNEGIDSVFGPGTTSRLADLPIKKPRNNYSEIVNGKVRVLDNDWVKRKEDKFCFSFFPISTDHVNRINGFMFDNAYPCSTFVFGSKDGFKKTLEWYMTQPCTSGLKVMMVGENTNKKLRFIKSLAALMKSLGSDAEPVWDESPALNMKPTSDMEKIRFVNEGMDEFIEQVRGRLDKSEPTESPSKIRYRCIYAALGMKYPPSAFCSVLTYGHPQAGLRISFYTMSSKAVGCCSSGSR